MASVSKIQKSERITYSSRHSENNAIICSSRCNLKNSKKNNAAISIWRHSFKNTVFVLLGIYITVIRNAAASFILNIIFKVSYITTSFKTKNDYTIVKFKFIVANANFTFNIFIETKFTYCMQATL